MKYLIYTDRAGVGVQITDFVSIGMQKTTNSISGIPYQSVLSEQEVRTFEARMKEVIAEDWESDCK